MALVAFRVRLAASLGLATFGCNSTPPTILSAPTTAAPLAFDASLPQPADKLVDLPQATKCKGYETEHKRCVEALADLQEARYPAPYASCSVAPNFSVAATEADRLLVDADGKKRNRCCYIDCLHIMRGRPLRAEDGGMQVAASSLRADFCARLEGVAFKPDAERATRWQEAALAEHASVGAFSQLSLQLLALGAPPGLLALTHQAALDEIRHAEIAFALASGYGDASVGPSPLIVNKIAYRTVAELAHETLVDGCVGEAASAMILLEDAAREPDPRVASLVREIVSDEERHVTLAWRIVRWSLAVEPSLLASLEATLVRLATRADTRGQIARDVAMPILAAISREDTFRA